MKIFVLELQLGEFDDPYDKYLAVAVLAESEEQARAMARAEASNGAQVWEDPEKVTCREVLDSDGPEIILIHQS